MSDSPLDTFQPIPPYPPFPRFSLWSGLVGFGRVPAGIFR